MRDSAAVTVLGGLDERGTRLPFLRRSGVREPGAWFGGDHHCRPPGSGRPAVRVAPRSSRCGPILITDVRPRTHGSLPWRRLGLPLWSRLQLKTSGGKSLHTPACR